MTSIPKLISELLGLRKKATSGKWWKCTGPTYNRAWALAEDPKDRNRYIEVGSLQEKDADFVIAAANDIRRLARFAKEAWEVLEWIARPKDGSVHEIGNPLHCDSCRAQVFIERYK